MSRALVVTARPSRAARSAAARTTARSRRYQQVYNDFQQYAQSSLDRGYVPLSIKDYVREYFSSLDPSN